MPMNHTGLAKLIEECGEVIQIAGKILALPKGQATHWDGGLPLNERLENEIADACAAMAFVVYARGLDSIRISERSNQKLELFEQWDANEKS